jgi:thiamine biosynthesis lipoprotein
MGTLLDVAARGPDPDAVGRAMEAAFAAVARVERLMSFHAADSELTHLNRCASQAPVTVDAWTYAVLRKAVRIADLSDGLFDVTVAPFMVEHGLLPRPSSILPQGGSPRAITLLSERRVFFERPLLIDLGGIAKGFAVDRAIHALRRGGCTDAIVNAGGDLRAFGTQRRPIHLRRRTGLIQVAELRCGAIATSSPHAMVPDRLAQPLGSIVHPDGGGAWHGDGSVMVAARTCVIADALTKVAALAGRSCGPLLERFGAQAYWDIDPDEPSMDHG